MNDEREEYNLTRMMEESVRVVREARMLPDSGPLSDDQRQGVRDQVRAYMERYALTHKHVARQVGGLQGGTLGEILNGTYGKGKNLKPERIDARLRELNEWLEIDSARRRTQTHDTFVELRVAKRLMNCVARAVRSQTMAIAYGPTGIGKSMVSHVIAERTPGAIHIEISKGDEGLHASRKMLVERLRLNRRRTRRDEPEGLTLNARIFNKLRDSGRLILIDEAHILTDNALHFWRNVWDQCKVPIVFVATIDLMERIRRDADADHGQLYGRIANVFDLTLDGDGDKQSGHSRTVFSLKEIRELFTSDRIKLTTDGEGYLFHAANALGMGSLRRCRNIVRDAADLERHVKQIPNNKPVTLHARVMEKVEHDSKHSEHMREDIKASATA